MARKHAAAILSAGGRVASFHTDASFLSQLVFSSVVTSSWVSSLLAIFSLSVTETTQERKVYLAPSLSERPMVAGTAWHREQLQPWWQKSVCGQEAEDKCWSPHDFGVPALGAVLPIFQGLPSPDNLSGNTPRDTPAANLLGVSRPSSVDSEDPILLPSVIPCPV